MQDFSSNTPLLLVGCGNMGLALAKGWFSSNIVNENAFWGIDPFYNKGRAENKALPEHHIVSNIDALPKAFTPKVIVLAVKPQMMENVIGDIRHLIRSDCLIISVAAGVKIEKIEKILGPTPIVRVMPNTPASIGKGITAMIHSHNCESDHETISEKLLGAVGETIWLENEAQMDVATAVSGSGPAYIFYLVETMTSAAEALGLPKEMASKLVRKTVAGAGHLLDAECENASELRKKVTSPKGTTAAALDILMANDGLKPLIEKAIKAAKNRSEELSE